MGVRESEHPIVLRKAGIATRATLSIGKGVPRLGTVGSDDIGDIELRKCLHKSRTDSIGANPSLEEPYALIGPVRICGSPGGAILRGHPTCARHGAQRHVWRCQPRKETELGSDLGVKVPWRP